MVEQNARTGEQAIGFPVICDLPESGGLRNSRVTTETLATSYFDRATELILQGRRSDAGHYLGRAIRLAPDEACFSRMAFGYLSQPIPRCPTRTFSTGPIFSVDVDKKKELILIGDFRGGVKLIRLSDGAVIGNYARTEKLATLSQVVLGPWAAYRFVSRKLNGKALRD